MASISATELPKQLFINNAFVDSKSNKTILQNTGQGCMVCSRVYVQEGLYDEFIAAYRDAMEARVKEFVRSGMVGINCISRLFLNTPFGGYKESGMGRECGLVGLTSWMETKTVMINMT
ncbi:aldehyde dehydrogenase [Fusarium oxysporum f. sp. phaseoli]